MPQNRLLTFRDCDYINVTISFPEHPPQELKTALSDFLRLNVEYCYAKATNWDLQTNCPFDQCKRYFEFTKFLTSVYINLMENTCLRFFNERYLYWCQRLWGNLSEYQFIMFRCEETRTHFEGKKSLVLPGFSVNGEIIFEKTVVPYVDVETFFYQYLNQ